MNLGWTEILLILGLVVLLFGGARLPQLGNALGKAISNFKKGIKGQEEEEDVAKKKGPPEKLGS